VIVGFDSILKTNRIYPTFGLNQQRSPYLAGYTFSVQKLRAIIGGSSPIAATAFLSVLVLGGVSIARVVAHFNPAVAPIVTAAAQETSVTPELTVDQLQEMILLGLTDASDAPSATSTDHLAMIGPMVLGEIYGSYAALRESGDYTKEDLQAAAEQIAVSLKAAVAYDAFESTDFTADRDTSTARVRTYRDELLTALEPVSSVPEAEYVILGRYMETQDATYLAQLKEAARAYRAAAERASIIAVPKDAVELHRDTLNALQAFASVLDGISDHANDPFASIALLRTYAEKEAAIRTAYDHMRSYYVSKAL
jgi:hypothetical protein